MIFSDTELKAVQNIYPDIFINDDKTKILGEFSFSAIYDGDKLHPNPPCQTNYKVFGGCYEIEIKLYDLNMYGLPKVFETSRKILKYAREKYIDPIDLHLNEDNSCCLSIFTDGEARNLTIYCFITEYVFSFFAWQAYLATFLEKPPWGEYSHITGYGEKIEEILKMMKITGRNAPCPCGSGLKFKKCCLDNFSKIKLLHTTNNKIGLNNE